jgi:hypothetical protein
MPRATSISIDWVQKIMTYNLSDVRAKNYTLNNRAEKHVFLKATPKRVTVCFMVTWRADLSGGHWEQTPGAGAAEARQTVG